MFDSKEIVFTGEFLDCAAGITVERPNSPHPYDASGRLGSVVTLPGNVQYVLMRELPEQQWLGERLA